MGYTHYWKNNKKINDQAWSHINEDFKKVIKSIDEEIIAPEEGNEFIFGDEIICFNGKDEQHETMWISRQPTDFEFCKTARKPYDLFVMCLLIIVHNYHENFTYSSDGDMEEWQEGFDLIEQVLGMKAIPILDRGEE